MVTPTGQPPSWYSLITVRPGRGGAISERPEKPRPSCGSPAASQIVGARSIRLTGSARVSPAVGSADRKIGSQSQGRTLIDARREAELEYTNYVISNLISVHEVPWTIAVTNIDKSGKKVPPKIKSVLDLPKGKTLLTCDVTNKDDVREVVMSIKSFKNK